MPSPKARKRRGASTASSLARKLVDRFSLLATASKECLLAQVLISPFPFQNWKRTTKNKINEIINLNYAHHIRRAADYDASGFRLFLPGTPRDLDEGTWHYER